MPHAPREDGHPFDTPLPPFRATPTARQLAACIERDETDGVWRCRYCRIEVTQIDQPWTWDEKPMPERDHVVPRSRGGSNRVANLVVSCQGCNVRKGGRPLGELPTGWAQWRLAVTP